MWILFSEQIDYLKADTIFCVNQTIFGLFLLCGEIKKHPDS